MISRRLGDRESHGCAGTVLGEMYDVDIRRGKDASWQAGAPMFSKAPSESSIVSARTFPLSGGQIIGSQSGLLAFRSAQMTSGCFSSCNKILSEKLTFCRMLEDSGNKHKLFTRIYHCPGNGIGTALSTLGRTLLLFGR